MASFTGFTSSSRGTRDGIIAPPPSYRSNSQQESDTSSIVSWGSNPTNATPDRATHTADLAVSAASTIKLLNINYEEISGLALCPHTFEDLEIAIRETLSIPDTKPIFVHADIPSFDNKRMLLNRDVWPVIRNDLSVLWITDSKSSSVTSSTTSGPVTGADTKQVTIRIYLSRSNEGFVIPVKDGSTIRDLKQAISSRFPRYTTSRIVIRDHVVPVKPVGDDEWVTETSYYLQYFERDTRPQPPI